MKREEKRRTEWSRNSETEKPFKKKKMWRQREEGNVEERHTKMRGNE